MHNKPFIFSLLGLLCFTNDNFSQQTPDYIFKHIQTSDGLLHSDVNAIAQDGKGYIWILTTNGLQRFDGSRFVNYPYNLNSRGGIIDTRDAKIVADKKNNALWITGKEVEKLDLQTNTFKIISPKDILDDGNSNSQKYNDQYNRTWVFGDFGFVVLTDTSRKMKDRPSTPVLISTGKRNSFFIDPQSGDTWMTTWSEGLCLFQKRANAFFTHDHNPVRHPFLETLNITGLTGILKDSEHNMWFSTGKQLFYRYNSLSNKLSTYSLADINAKEPAKMNKEVILNVRCLFEDNHHVVWIGTENAGLLRYNRDTDSFTSILNDGKTRLGLHYNYMIYCIFQDAEENIWVGTDKGVSIFNPYRQHFKSIHHEENNSSSLPKNEVDHFIQAANGDILVGTWGGGITVYDSNWNFKKNIYFAKPFEYNLVWCFIQKDDHTIWAGCQHGYMHVYDPFTQNLKTIHLPEFKHSTIRCMTKDNEGNIWFGQHNGKIVKWDKQQNKFLCYNDSLKGISQSFAPILNIFFDSHQRCWVSTESGLKQFDTQEMIYSAVYLPDKTDPNAISAFTTEGIEEYNDSILAIGTLYGGLELFNTRRKTFAHITTSDGLPSTTIYTIKKDAAGYLWFTTDNSLCKFKPGEKKFIRYNIDPDIISSSFKLAGFYSLFDGKWLTSTFTEILCFDPAMLDRQNDPGARVEVTGFRVLDDDWHIDSLLAVHRPVVLGYQQNFLTIEFALLNFSNQQQTKYYYRLSGVNGDWVNAGVKQFASYTNLEAGEYTFSVKAQNGDSSTGLTSFKIIITPPFWKTWWFRSLLVILAVGFIYWLVKRRIKTIRHEAGLKQKIAETEMMALRAQMNPHFIFNCLNAIDNLVQTNQKEKATTYLARFAKLIRSVLDSSKNNVVPFQNDYESLQLYLQMEQFRCNNKFTYEITADDELLQSDYKLPPLIVQPFVENAIHHGLLNKEQGERNLKVAATLENDHIKYTVTDNGVGRARAAQIKELNKPGQQSYGVEITADRLHLYNQNTKSKDIVITDLSVNGQPAGTRVEIYLKIGDNK